MKDWDDLRYFLSVARAGNVTAAARKLGVNHSTVSRRICAFEERLGIKLFERLPSGYALSPLGEELLGSVQGVERDITAISRKIASQDMRMKGSLRVTVPESIFSVVLMPKIASFNKMYPDIEIEITGTPQIVNLNNREADLAIRVTNRPPEGLVGRRLTEQRLAKYASLTYLKQHGLEPEAISDSLVKVPATHTWVGLIGEKATPGWVDTYYPGSKCAARLDSVFGLFEAVKAGLGIAELPCRIGCGDPRLIRVPPLETVRHDDIWVLYHRDMRHISRLRAFSDFLIKTIVAEQQLFMCD